MTRKIVDDANPKDRLGVKKAPLFLVPFVATIQMARAFAEGAQKYGAFNWRNKKVKRSVYIEAAMRHLIALGAGENIDPDSGLPHEAKVMACCAIMLDAAACGQLLDDRFEMDRSAALLSELTLGDYAKAAKAIRPTPARTLDEVVGEQVRRTKAQQRRRARKR